VRAPVCDKLAEILGQDYLAEAPPSAAVDGIQPRLIVRPADVEQVSRVLALARAEGLAVIPRGAGMAAGLGNPPARADLVLDLRRLTRIVEYEPADVSVSVEAGMGLEELARVLGKQRQRLPLDPPGWRARTLGGVLATNASGPLRARYGTARDLLLGARFVQADGSVTWGGSRVVKSVSGYDVPKLMVGSLGTLGVIVEATLRLHPEPDAERSWLLTFDGLGGATGFLASLFDSTLQPARVEILDAATLGAFAAPLSPPSAGAIGVAVSIASVDEAVRAQGERVIAFATRSRGAVRELGDGFWDAYDATPMQGAAGGIRLRLACLAGSVTGTIQALRTIAGREEADLRVAGCAATGTLRALLEGERSPEAWQSRVLSPLRERLAGDGGSVVVEQCSRELKERADVWGPVDAEAFALMRRIKAEFDPTGVLNPGRFVGRL
jgi:glycolate oxidase FAD binding subunit